MLKVAFHSIYTHPLPEGHRFPMEKYDLLPSQLKHEGTCEDENFFEPGMPELDHVLKVHDASYVSDLQNLSVDKKMARRIGFPLSNQLIQREFVLAQGTILACDYAMTYGIAMNIAGGTHHAFSNKGEAFCLLNDQAIGAKYVQDKFGVKKVLMVDLDVHQGNGTAEIFQNDDSVFTFSMHGAGNYPFVKEMSDLDIELPNDCKDDKYLDILKKTLPRLILEQQPDFIFYLSGVDVIASDKLGKLGMTVAGCKERDRIVLQSCFDLNIPVMCSMGGGYSPEIKTIVDAHANTYRLAQEIFFS
ncbi:MAG: acetoin utilization deacetylase AcuC-like enzyme [Salibacteraceae bacterium]|jgi:acetoin utilization deacetylase AcuC-like enzyme